MSRRFRCFLAAGILLVAVAYCLRLVLIPISGEIRGGEYVIVVVFAYLKGLNGPWRTEKRFDAPSLAKFALSPSEPSFLDGGLSIPIEKDKGQVETVIFVTIVLALAMSSTVLFGPQFWDRLNSA